MYIDDDFLDKKIIILDKNKNKKLWKQLASDKD